MVVDRLKQYQISSQAPPVQTTIAKVHSSSTYSEPDEALDATTGGGKPPLTVRPLPGLPGIKEDSTSITIADANLPTLDAFLKQADTVQERIQVVHSNTRELAHQYSISLRSTNPIEMQDCSERIETLVASIHQSADVIKLTLRSMQDTTRGLQEAKDASRVADLRIFENQNNFLLRQFMEAMSSFHSTQSENEKRFKDQVVRRLKAKFRSDDGGTISDAKAEAMALQILEHGSGDAIFMQSKHKLEEIIETRNEVFKIEQSLRALHQLFADVATLIHEQSDLMNSIEHNVQTTSNYVEKAVSELKTARRYNKKAKRKLCCITATALLIVGGICVIIFGFRLVKF